MKNLFFLLLLSAVVLATATSCDKKRVFDSYSEIGPEGWPGDSVKIFPFTIADTVRLHRLYINLRNRTSYNYSNIWLFIEVQSPGSKILSDTVQFILADSAGKWLGKGFAGIIDNRLPYLNNFYFPQPGEYRISIRHGMRQEVLKGISDIGIRIEKR